MAFVAPVLGFLPKYHNSFIHSDSHSSFKQQVSSIRCGGQDLAVSGLCFGLTTAPKVFIRVMAPVSAFLHQLGVRILRYLDDWLILASSREGSSFGVMRFSRNYCNSRKVLSSAISDCILSRGQDRLADFPGFGDSIEDRKVLLNSKRISVLRRSVCEVLESSVGSPGLSDPSCARRMSLPACDSAGFPFSVGLSRRVHHGRVGRLFASRSSVMV